jgi:hypothetical protein
MKAEAASKEEVLAPETDAQRLRVRLLSGSIVLAFLAQMAFVGKAEEPYPALMMPRFGWAGPSSSESVSIAVPNASIRYSDGSERSLSLAELFPDVPAGHRPTLANSMLAVLAPDGEARRAPEGKYEPPGWLLPGYRLARVSRRTPEHVASVRRWAVDVGRAHRPGAEPETLIVRWYSDEYAYDVTQNPTRSKQARSSLGTFELSLHAAAPAQY